MRTILSAATLLMVSAPSAAIAQSQDLPGRVDRLEQEMHAVQRKVFPGGAGQFVQPEITAPPTGPEIAPGSPSTSPLTDLNGRVTTLEQQMAATTDQIEQTQHRMQLLSDDFAAYKRATDARLAALERQGAPAGPGPAATPNDNGTAPDDDQAGTTGGSAAIASSGGQSASDAVEKPSTGDPAEDDYIYGYRLWAAHQYPEAETQLKSVVAKYPQSRRASYAQNLLGRSYLDDGKPSLASIAFYDNYKKMPDGERAPDSLFYLAKALMQLNKPTDACKVYSELTDVYSSKISDQMKADVAHGRTTAHCQ